MEPPPRYVEDGAGAEERDLEEERDAAEHRAGRNGAPPAVTKWTWMALAAAGVAVAAAAGGLILAYCLYRRIRRLEMAPSGNVEASDALARLARKVSLTVHGINERLAAVEKALKSAKSSSEVSATLDKHSQTLSALTRQLNAMAAKQNNVALKVETAAKDVATASTKVSAVQERLVDTQRFIVEMAQRQKWPWPFNNRIRGLEEEFGLPKK